MGFTIDAEKALWDDATYADVLVHCQGREWHCHRVVLCPQSSYFAKKCLTYTSRDGVPNNQKPIVIEDKHSPEDVEFCLKFMYVHIDYQSADGVAKEEQLEDDQLFGISNLAHELGSTGLMKWSAAFLDAIVDGFQSHEAMVRMMNDIHRKCIDPALIKVADEWERDDIEEFLQDVHVRALLSEASVTKYLDSFERKMRDSEMRPLLSQESVDTYSDTLNRRMAVMGEQVADEVGGKSGKRKRTQKR
ncbi:hypothetical protein TI39_contig4376g00002 [Zymoseptoria brevis]|uniref:BTB domain-containing protein n=1 Tax=Zymoseptoria brevis TaxID=1047168 RepID=A0A0F4G721_9PEZI|nr:hypothetical protein TI39_contig4376g00002 [Zymoseptoria brevis]